MAAKTEKSAKNSAASASPIRDERRLLRRTLWLLAGFVVVILLSLLLLKEGSVWLFNRNPRFVLTNLQIESTGYWAKNDRTKRQLCNLIGLPYSLHEQSAGEPVTVFSEKLGDLRERLELIPSVESAMVERILPGTLKLTIEERIPRAMLNSFNSGMVIDSHGVVMDKRFCQAARGDLPVLMTERSDWQAGMLAEELKAALELVMVIQQQFPDIRLLVLNAADSECMAMKINFRGIRDFQVLLKPENYVVNLAKLQSACEQEILANGTHTIANMMYNVGVTWQ